MKNAVYRLFTVLTNWRWALALALALPSTVVHAEEVTEYGMKAVLLYRLPQFIYWPEGNPPRPATLCIVGKNPFGAALGQLKQGTDNIEVRTSPADLGACHLLFISRSESNNLDTWFARTDGKRIVTVSDIPGFARAGGMVELPLEGDRVSIVVNRNAAVKKGMDFNAQLLRLARVIAP